MFLAQYRATEAGARRMAAERCRALPAPQTARIAPSAPVAAPVASNVVPISGPSAEKMALRKLQSRAMPEWARVLTAEVAAAHGILLSRIVGPFKHRAVVVARNEVFYRLKTDARAPSYPLIAGWFCRDASGILWAVAIHARDNGLPQITSCDVESWMERNRVRCRARDRKRK